MVKYPLPCSGGRRVRSLTASLGVPVFGGVEFFHTAREGVMRYDTSYKRTSIVVGPGSRNRSQNKDKEKVAKEATNHK